MVTELHDAQFGEQYTCVPRLRLIAMRLYQRNTSSGVFLRTRIGPELSWAADWLQLVYTDVHRDGLKSP